MKIAVFFFLAMAFAVGVSSPVNMTDGAEEDFKFKNGTEVDEPEEFSNDTVLDQDKEDNETVNSGDFFVTANFSGTEQPEEKRSLTTDDPIIEPESGSGPLDAGSTDIETASGIKETASGIKELPTDGFLNNEEEGGTDEEEGGTDVPDKEGGTEDSK